jgi:hypothetical protein
VISSELYCPECGALWDMILCDDCGFTSEEFVQKRRLKTKEKEERPQTKVSHRPRNLRKEEVSNGDGYE